MEKYSDTTEKLVSCAEKLSRPMQISILHNRHKGDKLNDHHDVTI
jgi:hypothetical protein